MLSNMFHFLPTNVKQMSFAMECSEMKFNKELHVSQPFHGIIGICVNTHFIEGFTFLNLESHALPIILNTFNKSKPERRSKESAKSLPFKEIIYLQMQKNEQFLNAQQRHAEIQKETSHNSELTVGVNTRVLFDNDDDDRCFRLPHILEKLHVTSDTKKY